jgi:very-short-patch-repair endonuclease
VVESGTIGLNYALDCAESATGHIMDKANILLEIHLNELGLKFMREHKFHPKRRWRFDYIIFNPRMCRTAVEIEGAIWTQGRHTRGSGYTKDLEKYREAAVLGWRVLRFSTQEVLNGTARAFIKEHCV